MKMCLEVMLTRPPGSGKSTLLKLLAGKLQGASLKVMPVHAIRAQLTKMQAHY